MTAHVFIVNEDTFPVHLEYQFAGTLSGTSRNIGLYTDIARVRNGDRVYFYLLNEGFYGPFKIEMDEKGVWWDSQDPTYLQDKLGLRLIYRVRVVNDGAYPIAVSEWNSLDKFLREPEKCLWSLVYRKLKGKRGCTMIFPWEDEFLFDLIKKENENKSLNRITLKSDEYITWNSDVGRIIKKKGAFSKYSPNDPAHICKPEDPLIKIRSKSGTETHIQAFLTKNYGFFPESELIFGKNDELIWVGNEVACGVGMQKIDLFAINQIDNKKQFRIIELKRDPPDPKTVNQFFRYIEWTKKFVKGAENVNIQPVLLCRNLDELSLSSSIKDSFKEFNTKSKVLPLVYIECLLTEKRVFFKEIDYNAR